jgi:hypothetical protein
MNRIKRLSANQILEAEVILQGEEAAPYWLGMMRLINDTVQHTSQISYLRGLVTGIGWQKPIDWTSSLLPALVPALPS